MSINRVIISGNLTREPDLRAMQSGKSVLNFSMAVNDRRQNRDTGEWEDVPNYVDCVVWGGRADWLSRTLHKGMKVCVEGKLRYSSWETKAGERRSRLEVAVDEIELLEPKKVQEPPAQQPSFNAPKPPQQEQIPPDEIYDEDIPF